MNISWVNAHLFAKPSANKSIYYWARLLKDPVYGISGFIYIDAGKNVYYVLAKSIDFLSYSHAVVTAEVTVGNEHVPGILKANFNIVGGICYVGFVVTDAADSAKVLDFSIVLPAVQGGKITMQSNLPHQKPS